MDFSLSYTAGDLMVFSAAGVLAWQARNMVAELRALVRRVDQIEAWAEANFGFEARR